MIHFDLSREDILREDTPVSEFEEIDEVEGKLAFQSMEDKLMHSVMENDKDSVDKGKLIRESVNQGLSSFTPDLMFEQMVKNFSMAKNIYGETIIRELTGYEDDFVKNNIKIPEFQREIKKKMKQKIDELKRDGILERDGTITEKAVELSAIVTFMEELNKFSQKSEFGERVSKNISIHGDKEDHRNYRKGDRYRDFALKASIKNALRRGHNTLLKEDLKTYTRQSKTKNVIIYALDASGSMKGKKIDSAKRAGIALAYNAIMDQDQVGLLVFGAEILDKIMPTDNFSLLLKTLGKVKAAKETDLTNTIKHALMMFPQGDVAKHLIILSDAVPTIGKEPEKETLAAVMNARAKGITISVIGIALDKKGTELAQKIAELGEGRFFLANNLDELDTIVLQDYYQSR